MTEDELDATKRRALQKKQEKRDAIGEKDSFVNSGAESAEELDRMLEAQDEIRGLQKGVKETLEEVKRVENEKQWRKMPSVIQAEQDLQRYMHEIGLGKYAEGVNEQYEELLQEPLQQGNTANSLVGAVLRDRFWLQRDEVAEVLDISETTVYNGQQELGFKDVKPALFRRRIEEFGEKYGEDAKGVIQQYSMETPGARPEEMAAAIDLAQTPEYAQASIKDAANYFDADPEAVERASEYLEEKTEMRT